MKEEKINTQEATLTSLAMLKVHIDQNKDYLEYLRPFIEYVLFKFKPESITDQYVTEMIKKEFGLVIPCRSVQILLKRITKSGYIKKIGGVYQIQTEFKDPGIDARIAEASRHISSVICDLIGFWKNETSRELTEEEAINSIIDFLSEFSIPSLKAYLRGTALPEVTHKKPQNIVLISKFIIELNKSNPERFESFMVLMQGHMLANGILCPDLQTAPKSYRGVTFYFDTPLIIQLFGFEGNAKKKSTNELINLLKQLDGNIGIFSHTLEEFKGVLKGAADKIDSVQGQGAMVFEARRSGKTKSDFLLFLGQIEKKLEEANIVVLNTPKYSMTYQISEKVFEHLLDDEISYNNPSAKRNDINSVRSIYELRQGTSPSTIEKSKAVLVTNNAAFSKSAYEYGKQFQESREVSSVITDFSIANMAWLKAPMGASSLPRKEVIAYSYAALCPSKELLNKYLNQIELLKEQGNISEGDHQLLRSNYLVNDELMTLTLGVEHELTEESILEINKRVTNEIRKEEHNKLSIEKENHQETKQKLKELRAQTDKVIQNSYWKCRKKSLLFKRILISILIIFILIATVVSFGLKPQAPVLSLILFVSMVVFSILSILNLYIGTTVKEIGKNFENKLFLFFLRREERLLGLKIEGYSD